MLNIELVRFEAQDVITASVMRPHHHHKPEQKPAPAPTEPVIPCTCVPTYCQYNGAHISADYSDCQAKEHNCGF